MTKPEQLKYATSHEWVRVEDNGELTIGITVMPKTNLVMWFSLAYRRWDK